MASFGHIELFLGVREDLNFALNGSSNSKFYLQQNITM